MLISPISGRCSSGSEDVLEGVRKTKKSKDDGTSAIIKVDNGTKSHNRWVGGPVNCAKQTNYTPNYRRTTATQPRKDYLRAICDFHNHAELFEYQNYYLQSIERPKSLNIMRHMSDFKGNVFDVRRSIRSVI